MKPLPEAARGSALGTRRGLMWCVLANLLLLALPAAALAATTTTFNGHVSKTGTSWRAHQFEMAAGNTLTATLDWSGDANLDLFLQDPAGTWVRSATSTTAKPEVIRWDATSTGTWVLGVRATSGAADYDLAAVLGSAGELAGTVSSSGVSWRSHPLALDTGPITLTLDWNEPGANLDLFLRSPNGTWVQSATSTTAKPEVITYDVLEAGTWSVGVRATSGSADYTIQVGRLGSGAVPRHLRDIGGAGRAEMYPSGLDVDAAGRLYVADTGNDQVAAYASDGNPLWRVGTRGRQPGQFAEPRDVAVVGSRVYVADTGSNRVQVLDAANGKTITTWNTWFGAAMGISQGQSPDGTPLLLVTDGTSGRVGLFRENGTLLRWVGAPGTADGQLNAPRDAATDDQGNVFVADFRNHRIAVFAPNGGWLGSFGTLGTGDGQLRAPYGVAIDDQGRLYVADSNNARVQVFTRDGEYLAQWGRKGDGPLEFEQLRRVAVGPGQQPRLYAADLWGNKVDRWTQDGVHELSYGGAPPALGGFNKPYGFTVTDGQVFVSDTGNQRIQRFSRDGTFELAWGDRGWAEDAQGLNWPRDIAFSEQRGSTFVADSKNQRVLEFGLDGSRREGQIPQAVTPPVTLNWPQAVDVLGDDVIVADTFNHRVQRWTPQGGLVWTATGFNFPKDVDAQADVVLVADSLNKRIVRLRSSDGTTLGSIGADHLNRPEGVAQAPGGTIWVADTSWNRLVELRQDGSLVQRFGSGGTTAGRFNEPTKLEIAEAGGVTELYVADTGNDRLQVFRIN